MKSENYGANSDAERAFDAKYRDENGKVKWDKISEDSRSLPRITIAEILERIQKQREAKLKEQSDEEQRGEENTSDNAA